MLVGGECTVNRKQGSTSKLQAIESPVTPLEEVELQLAERERRISELEQLHEQLRKQAEDNEVLPTDKAA